MVEGEPCELCDGPEAVRDADEDQPVLGNGLGGREGLQSIEAWSRGPSESRAAVVVWLVDVRTGPSLPRVDLAEDERERIERLRDPLDRRRARLAYGLRRWLVGRSLGEPPRELAFERRCATCGSSDHGKPRVADTSAGEGLCFNVSHSHETVAIALARDRELGIDIEWVDREVSLNELVPTALTPRERTWLFGREDRTRAFLKLWTRKEAFLKWKGHGLNVDPRDVDALDAPRYRWTAPSGERTEVVAPTSPVAVDAEIVGTLVGEGPPRVEVRVG